MRLAGKEYKRYNHSVGRDTVHLCWIPARRRKVLFGAIKPRLYEILQQVAIDKGWQISAVTIETDHVHLLVEYDPDHSISQVAKAFKGRSSRMLRKEFPELLKMPSLWTHGYFHETTGKVSTSAIMAYINSPHHDGK